MQLDRSGEGALMNYLFDLFIIMPAGACSPQFLLNALEHSRSVWGKGVGLPE